MHAKVQPVLLSALLSLTACASPAPGSPLADASAPDEASFSESPFTPFFGTWTLADDRFQQVWDTQTLQTLEIPNHITRCGPVNTEKTVLCVVDAGDLKGHILWAIESDGKALRHLSHFGDARLGTGHGVMNEAGDLSIEIQFTDEPADTYRHYTYTWIDADTYEMISTQMDSSGQPTGNWYGGVFVRLVSE